MHSLAEDIFWEPLLEGLSVGQSLTVREVVLPVHVAEEDELLAVVTVSF